MSSWVFLLVGSVGAVGAALVVGTLGALVAWYRHGHLPGMPDDAGAPAPRTITLLWVRVVLGAVVAAVAVVVLLDRGLL